MRKRLTMGLAAGLLMAAMPLAVTADGVDSVTGTATFSTLDNSRAWVNARSDADGSNAAGTYRIDIQSEGVTFTADVVCLNVEGSDAVIGAIVTNSSGAGAPAIGTGVLHFVTDAGSPGTSDTSVTVTDAPANDCESYSVADAPLQPVQSGNWVVRDR